MDGNIIEKLYDSKGELVVEMTDVPEEQQVKEEEYRELYNPETHTIDFGKQRPTDIKSNPRVCMPQAGNEQQEAELACREIMTDKTIEAYLEMRQRDSSLTPSEQEGLKSLLARIKAKEIIIYPTDKSGKLAVTTFENYHKQGQVHVRKDKEVNWGEVNEIQNRLKSHMRALNLIFNTGIGH